MEKCNMLRPGCNKEAKIILLTLDWKNEEHVNPCCDNCLRMVRLYEGPCILDYVPL